MTNDQIIDNYLEFFISSLTRMDGVVWDYYLAQGTQNYISYDITVIGNKKIMNVFHIDASFISHLSSLFTFINEREDVDWSSRYLRKKIIDHVKRYKLF